MQTIVIVDDEYYFRQAIKRYLSEWEDEYRFIGETRNGKEGLELIRQLQPDIVLMDINMPVMSGLDVVQALLNRDAGEKLQSKIILLTGYGEFEYAQKAIRLGVFDYLLKPIDKQQLKKCLDQAVSQIKSERQHSARHMELEIRQYIATPMVKEHFVNKAFTAGNEADWTEMERMAGEILNLREQSGWQVFIVDVYLGNVEHEEEKGLSFYYFIISNILTELLERKEIQCLTSVRNDSLYAVVSGRLSAPDLEKAVLEIQKGFLNFIQQKAPLSLLISSGSAKENLREIGSAVQEANLVQKFMLMYRKKGIYNRSHLNLNDTKLSDFFGNRSSQFILYIRTDNVPAMEALVKEIFSEMKKNEVRPEIVFRRAGDMVSCAFDVLQIKDGGGTEDNTIVPMLPPEFTTGSIDQIQTEVLRYIKDIMQMIRERKARKKLSLSANVACYIEENYYRYDLSLLELSTVFGVSKTILCQQFKEAAGMTIGEYMLQTRMSRAKRMLDEGYYNVTFVAEKCGYEDAGYFSKCFKKYFGVSPRDYCEARGG